MTQLISRRTSWCVLSVVLLVQFFSKPLETWHGKWHFIERTLIGTQGYSGNAAATALAPASLVHCDKPTKNSLPASKTKKSIEFIEPNSVNALNQYYL